MCNEIRRRVAVGDVRDVFADLKIPLRFPEGIPNLEAVDSVRITDPNPIVRIGADGDPELVVRRWSWPGSHGKPIYNLRSEGRNFDRCRCLILADGFYEFTANEDPKARLKHKWMFRRTDAPFFFVAGITRDGPAGEAFTMLTAEPGPDVQPYHSRQIVVLGPGDWLRWLDPNVAGAEILKPPPAGTLVVEQVR